MARPIVVVYANLEDTSSSQEIWSLVIENVGNEAAHNIRFKLPKDGIYRAFADGKEKIIEDGPLIAGVPMLPRGQRLKLWWGVGTTHYDRYFKAPSKIVAQYQVYRPRLIGKAKTKELTTENEIRIDGFDYQQIKYRRTNNEGVKIQASIPEIRGLHN